MRDADACLGCALADGRLQPPGGLVVATDLWTVNHRLGAQVQRGWLVLQPRRHVLHVGELTGPEWRDYIAVTGALDPALRETLNAVRVYIACFSEDPTWHLHFHVVPRYAGQPIGPMLLAGTPANAVDEQGIIDTTSILRRSVAERLKKATPCS